MSSKKKKSNGVVSYKSYKDWDQSQKQKNTVQYDSYEDYVNKRKAETQKEDAEKARIQTLKDYNNKMHETYLQKQKAEATVNDSLKNKGMSAVDILLKDAKGTSKTTAATTANNKLPKGGTVNVKSEKTQKAGGDYVTDVLGIKKKNTAEKASVADTIVKNAQATLQRDAVEKVKQEKLELPRYGLGNIDLNKRKVVNNSDGSISTEQSFSFHDDRINKEVLIPAVVNGKVLNQDDAIQHYLKTNEYLGKFDTPEEADKYAEDLHKEQEKYYSKKKNTGALTRSFMEQSMLAQAADPNSKMGQYLLKRDVEANKGIDLTMKTDAQLAKDQKYYKGLLKDAQKKESAYPENKAELEQNRDELYLERGKLQNFIVRGVPEYYTPEDQWQNLQEDEWLTKRPENYFTDDYVMSKYNRALYDAMNGEGAYDSIMLADEATDEEIEKLDNEISRMWDRIENGDIQQDYDKINAKYNQARTDAEGEYGVSGYQKQLDSIAGEMNRRNTIRELENGKPEGTGEYDPNAVQWGLFSAFDKDSKINQIYTYANMDINEEGRSDFSKYIMTDRPEAFMNNAQRKVFNDYFTSGDKASALAYYEALEPYLNQIRLAYKDQLEYKMSQNEYAPLMAFYRIGTKPVEAAAGTVLTGMALLGNEEAQNPNSRLWHLSRTNQNIQNARADAWEKQMVSWFGDTPIVRQGARLLNGVVYSMADNLVAMGLAGGTAANNISTGIVQLVMSTEATAGDMLEKLQAGVDGREAALYAFGSGIIEAITEKYSIEELLKPNAKELLGDWKQIAKFIGKNFVTEGSEEIASDALNLGLDFVLSGLFQHENEIQAAANELMAQNPGMSRKQAEEQAWKNKIDEMLQSGVSGALSGLALSAGRVGTNAISMSRSGQNIQQAGNTVNGQTGLDQMVNAGLMMKGTTSERMARKIKAQMDAGKSVSDYEAGKLGTAMITETNEEIGNIVKGTMVKTVQDQLAAKGLAASVAQKAAPAIVRSLQEGKVSPADQAILTMDQRILDVWKGYNTISGEQAELLTKVAEETKSIRETRDTVLDLMGGNVDAKQEEDTIRKDIANAPVASKTELLLATGQRTGNTLEAIAQGKLADIKGIAVENSRNEETGEKERRYVLEMSDGRKVDIADVTATNKGTAQVLKYLQGDQGTVIGENLANTILQIAYKDKTGDMSKTIAGAVRTMWAEATNTSARLTGVDSETAESIREAVAKDLQQAEDQRLKGFTEIKPGEGRTTFNGAEYGTEQFNREVNKLGKTNQQEAQAIGRIAQSIGVNVELYNDTEDTANQGSFTSGGGIRINLAGTFTTDGAHRSALATLAHEITHNLEANSRDGYNALKKFIFTSLRDSFNIQNELQGIMDTYRRHGENLDLNGAIAELVAKGCEQVLTNEDVIKQLQQEAPEVQGKIRSALEKLLGRIRALRSDVQMTSSRYAKALMNVSDEVGQKWIEAYSEARQETGEAENANKSYSFMNSKGEEVKLTGEQVEESKRKISEMSPVVEVKTNKYIKNAEKDMKTMGTEYFDSIGNKAVNRVLGDVALNEDGVQHLVRWLTKRRAGLIEAVKPVIEKGEIIQIDEKGASHDFDSAIIAAPVMFEGKPYYMAVVVKQNGEKKNSYYFHDAILVNKNVGVTPLNKSLPAQTLGANPTIQMILSSIPEYNGINGKTQKSFSENKDTSEWKYFTRRDGKLYLVDNDGSGNEVEMTGADVEYYDAWKKGDYTRMEEMLAEKIRENGAVPFKTPYSYNNPDHAFVANAIKKGDMWAIRQAAAVMATMVPKNAVLVPMPNHYGQVNDDTDTMVLANEISAITGAPVVKALKGIEREKRKDDKNKPKSQQMKAADLGFYQAEEIPEGKVPYIVDNVIASGLTAEAAHRALGNNGVTLAYAKSSRTANAGLKRANATFYDTNKEYGSYLIPLSERINMEKKGYPGTKFSVQELEKTYDSLNIDPVVYFTGTEEQIEATDQAEAQRAEEFRKLIDRNEFMALEFVKPDGRREILHASTRPGIRYQLSYIGSDGIPSMHESYGLLDRKAAGEESVHSMDELYKHFVRENLRSDLKFNVMEDRVQKSFQEDETYMDAVKAGDMDAAQQMVDKAAKNAGYTIRGDHGTVSKYFTVFDREKGNPEGDWGKGFYFSNSAPDVNLNYANPYGGDITAKIDQLAEKLEYMDEYSDKSYEELEEIARDMLAGGKPRVITAALRMENPVVLGGENPTFFDYSEEYDEETDEYGEPEGSFVDLMQALQDVLDEEYEGKRVDISGLWQYATDWQGMSAEDFQKNARIALEDLTDEEGNLASNEAIRQAFEYAGYDGIIDNTVAWKFGNKSGRKNGGMKGVNENTTHYIVFNPEQIKVTDPVTYDDNGNVIPLSERFNKGNNDIRYSVQEDQLESEYKAIRDKVADLRIKLSYMNEDYKAFEERIRKAEKDELETIAEEYGEWEKKSGYGKLRKELMNAEREERELRKQYDEYTDRKAEAEEQKKIEASGMTEEEWRRKQAIKEFGYTTDFREAGYLLPNGKMLNFCGDKGQHYGMRGNDHRDIGRVYAVKQGSDAMNAFIADGNIRIMAESPGIDLVTEPTTAQYNMIRNMAYRFADEDYFNIDFSDQNGNNMGSIEYEGNINSFRIVNDIRHYFRTGEIREQSAADRFRYSFQDETEMDIGRWMQTVTEGSLQTEAEKQMLRHYKDLRMRLDLREMQKREIQDKIRKLQQIPEQLRREDEKKQLKNLESKLNIAQKVIDDTLEELAKAQSGEGFARMMYQQSRVLNNFIYGRTQAEVRDAVENMEKSAQNIAQRIAENRKTIAELEKNSVVQQVKKVLGRTTIEQAAADLKKAYNSTWTKGEILNYLNPIVLKMAKGEDIDYDVQELAGILIDSNRDNVYEGLSGLRGLTITLGKGQQKELKGQNSSLKEIRRRLAGTGIQVKYGDRSTLEADIENLREEYPEMPDMGDEKDALENFVSWVEGMKRQSGAQEFYNERLAEAMSAVMRKAAGAMSGIYIPAEGRARDTVLQLIEFVKSLNAKTEQYEKELADIAKQMETMQRSGATATGMVNTLQRDVNIAIDYYNKMAKIAEDSAKQTKTNQLIEQLKSKQAQQILKNNEEWRNLIERDKQARAQAEDNRTSRSKINTVIKRMYNLLKNPKGLTNIPEHMQGLAREVIGTIVENDLVGQKISNISRTDLSEAKRVLDAWKKQSGEFNLADLSAMEGFGDAWNIINQDLLTIYDGIEKYNSEIRGKNKLDTLQQRGEILKDVQEAVSEIYSFIQAERQIAVGDRKIQVADAAYDVTEGTEGNRFKEWTGKIGRAIAGLHKAIISGNMTPEYFFRTLGNRGLDLLWDGYHEAENRNGLELKKAQEKLAAIAEKHGYKGWDTKQRQKIDLSSGEVNMTLGQLMSLYATWKREKTLGPEMSQHLEKGGFYVEETDPREGILGRAATDKKAHRVTEEDIKKITDILTEEQKQYVDDVVEYMSSDMSELGNEASMKAYGIKMYKESYYFPFQIWDGVKSRKSNEAGSAAGTQDRAFHPSFSKSRMHGAQNALVLGDFTQTAADHIAGMINYATMGLANENLQKVLNYQTDEGYGNTGTKRNVRAILEEAYGREAMQYLAELQKQLNGGAVKIDKTFYDRMISLFRKNAVAGSLSVAAQQPLSYIRAAMMINPKYMAKAAMTEYWKDSYKERMEHSGVSVIKEMGRFDMNFGQSAREYLMPEGKEGKAQKIWDFITDKATILPELMDRWTWNRMWVAVKAEQHALHPEMNVKSDAFLNLVGERFNDVMRRTQVYDSVLVKSANMRNQHPLVKSITSFMAEPTLTMNVLADSVRQIKEGEVKGKEAFDLARKTIATFVLSAVLQAVVKGFMGAGRTPDEKKTELENFLYRIGSNLINEADPLQLIPGYSDLVTILKDGKLTDDAMGAVGKIFTAGQTTLDMLMGKSDKSAYRTIEDSVAQLTQIFTNLPAKNIMRDARAMYNWFTGKNFADRESDPAVIKYQFADSFANADNLWGVFNAKLGEAGWETKNKAYYERIYEAKKAGDEQAAQDMINYLLNGRGVKESTIKSGITSAAKEDENTSAADTASFLISEGGNAEDYIRKQLREGDMTPDEARSMLKKANPEKDNDSIWWTVDRIEYAKEKGIESVSGSYYRLYDAIEENKASDIQAAVNLMTAHGMDKKNIKTQIGKKYKEDYLKASGSEKRKMKDALTKAYKAVGMTEADAIKLINSWK